MKTQTSLSLLLTLLVAALTHAQPLPLNRIDACKKDLWTQYLQKITDDFTRRQEVAESVITYDESTMKYEMFQIGDEPQDGYPLFIALHGGGGTAPEVNDSQWEHMKAYYRDSVTCGIYLAPRGVTNTWNLHCVDNSYPLYDRLIENLIAFKHVNPNRVYVLGYSAGGDGVYQIASRMSDRFAAANMSAGHPNNISVLNLANLPFLIQLGEKDIAYDRARQATDYAIKLDALANLHPGYYVHRLYLHANHGHHVLDRLPNPVPQEIIVDYIGWRHDKERFPRVSVDTNAIRWLAQFTRNPIPTKVIWDLNNIAPSRIAADKATPATAQQFYWLDLNGGELPDTGFMIIEAEYDRITNAIAVRNVPKRLRLLVNRQMLDFSKPVTVHLNSDFSQDITIIPNEQTMRSTLESRGDPSFMFEAEINIQRDGKQWKLTSP